MAQAIKTVEFPFTTLTATLATATTLAAATETVFSAVTVGLPESTKTIRSVHLQVTLRCAETTTTARRLNGVRIGVQIDAVAFNDGTDLTGTGIAPAADHYQVMFNRDVTSYFVTNYTGSSHTVGVRARFQTDVASLVNNITCKLIVTYEYDDSSATHVKTVRIPLEGNTAYLGTTANANQRGSTGAQQIPLLDTFLPETSKTFKKIWFEVHATDAGAAVTNFNANYSIDTGATATRATLAQAQNSSCRYFDIWVQDSLVTSSAHDFQAWSSLASRFDRLFTVLYVTYEFASSSTTIMNSLLIPLNSEPAKILAGTTTADRDVWDTEFWIEEPATITIKQSALQFICDHAGTPNITVSVEGLNSAGGSQGTTTSAYTISPNLAQTSNMFCHRIDVAHGGTAITFGRGRNTLRLKVFASTNVIYCCNGWFILNYTSGKSSQGLGAHNSTTQWMLADNYSDAIAGTSAREIATTNQKTPNIPQANYFLNNIATLYECNAAAPGLASILAEALSGEGPADGWAVIENIYAVRANDNGHNTIVCTGKHNWKIYPGDPITEGYNLDLESARKQRIYATYIQQSSLVRVITTHSIVFTISGTVSGSSGGTVTINAYSTVTGMKIATTSRTGNGSYSMTWYDNVENVFVEAYESGTLIGRSDNSTATGSA